jgi:hypothetical protein
MNGHSQTAAPDPRDLGGWVRLLNGRDRCGDRTSLARSTIHKFGPCTPGLPGLISSGRYHEALSAAEQCLRARPNFYPPVFLVAAASTLAGDSDRAQRAVARIREREPTACISDFEERMPFHRSEHLVRLTEGLRKAGYRSDLQSPSRVKDDVAQS